MKKLPIIILLICFVGCSPKPQEKKDARLQEIQQNDLMRIESEQKEKERKKSSNLIQVEQAIKPQYQIQYDLLRKDLDEFIKNTSGSLRNKTAREVKQYVDQWQNMWEQSRKSKLLNEAMDATLKELNLEWYDFDYEKAREKGREISDQFSKPDICSTEFYYKVFGKPERTQFVGSLNIYYFWYICTDGEVQIQIDAEQFDENLVNIESLNVF